MSQRLREPRQPFADHPISIGFSHSAQQVHANEYWPGVVEMQHDREPNACLRPSARRARGFRVCLMARVRRPEPASAPKCEGLLTPTITGMVAILGDADSMEPFQRVRIRMTDSVGAHPNQEVVLIREDVAGPTDHAAV
jgi:hypothetical protein